MAPPSSSPGLPMHKNRLQEYAQKSGLQLPTYSTINEGFQHAPKFRSTVLVGGTTYTSLLTFSNRKAAEQDAAKLALECVTKKTKDEGYLLIHQDPTICKLILHEFAVKTNMEIPTYTIIQSDDKCPVFVSSLVFGGKTYTGDTCKSKKEAKQLAARTAIQSLLGSGSWNLLNQIINSKFNLYEAVPKLNYPGFSQNVVPISVQPEGSSQHLKNVPPSAVIGSIVNSSCGRKRKLENNNSAEKKIQSHGYCCMHPLESGEYVVEMLMRNHNAHEGWFCVTGPRRKPLDGGK